MKRSFAAKEKFLVDSSGNRVAVVLDLPTYDRLLGAAEELAEVRAYDEARPRVMAELAKRDYTTLTDYRKDRAAKGK